MGGVHGVWFKGVHGGTPLRDGINGVHEEELGWGEGVHGGTPERRRRVGTYTGVHPYRDEIRPD